jgi:multidrug resistance efflux pump
VNLTNKKRVSVAVWIVGAVVATVWAGGRGLGVEGRGMATARVVEVAALETGRLAEVSVGLHDTVTAETIVAMLDTEPVERIRSVAAAELLALQEELSIEAADRSRRFAQGRESALVDRARLAVELSADQARASALRQELAIEQGLLAQGATAGAAVDDLRWRIGVVEARIQGTRASLAAANDAVGGASERDASLTQSSEWQVTAAVRRLEEIEARLARLQLRASLDGTVTWIHHQPGDVVVAGDPVLQIKEPVTREVVSFLPTSVASRAMVGGKASVVRESGQILQAHVRSVGTDLRELPPALLRNPAAPEWGVPVRVELTGDAVLGPDEPVTVRL